MGSSARDVTLQTHNVTRIAHRRIRWLLFFTVRVNPQANQRVIQERRRHNVTARPPKPRSTKVEGSGTGVSCDSRILSTLKSTLTSPAEPPDINPSRPSGLAGL